MYELGVRAIIKDNFGAILLVKNKHGLHANKWVLPGGRVESEELAINAVIREVHEELSLTFSPTFLTYREDLSSSTSQNFLTLFFTGTISGTINIQQEEICEYRFFTISEIKNNDNISPTHKEVILENS